MWYNFLIFKDFLHNWFLLTQSSANLPSEMQDVVCEIPLKHKSFTLIFFFFLPPALIESLIWSGSLMYCHICSLYCCVKRASAVWAYKWNQRRVKAKHSPRSIFQYLTSGNSNKYNARDTSMATSRQKGLHIHTHAHTCKRLVGFR